MIPFVIIGAGGHGAEVAAYALDMGLPLLGALDDGKPPAPWAGTQVLGTLDDLARLCQEHGEVGFITAFGSNAVRRKVVEQIEHMNLTGLKPQSLLHERVWQGQGNEIGCGTLMAPGSVLTTRAKIGRHCILNVKASVSHDCEIGDFCNINPDATLCGDVQLGEGCYVGAGATIIEKRKIGAWTTIGAGAVVTQDLPAGVTAVGVPARIIKQQGIPTHH